ncbi:hypothetical protein [Nocardioides sp.]|uniref:hypothetical protein n=1 Tax=Nocardioides sp. TaxID=35761 RepID=UPI0019AA5A92|nr:hypothetical protein [Nocardioides sp.]MBC7277870.1 hypothetical protein [Nocardioides sp.]
MKFGWLKTVAAIAALASTMYCSAPATAASASPTASDDTTVSKLATTYEAIGKAQLVEGDEAEAYVQQALREVTAVGTHVNGAEGESVGFANERVMRFEDGTVFVNFPLGGGELVSSALNVAISENGESRVFEILMRQINATSGSVEYWVGGDKVLDRIVEEPAEPEMSAKGWGEFIDCLESQSVPGWVITGITIACSVICVGTFGAACAACIGAAITGYGSVIGLCIQRATS